MFRLKIILLSVVLSGLIMAGLGFYSVSIMNRIGLARIDREMLTLGEGHLVVRPPKDYWKNFEASLRFIYGEAKPVNIVVQVRDERNGLLFRSANWPQEIGEGSFPHFDPTMDTSPPKPEERPGPPDEAYRSCEGKKEGSAGQFTRKDGEVITGTCEKDGGRLVLRPDRNRVSEDPRNRSGFQPGPSGDPGSRVPRIKKTPRFATLGTSTGMWRMGIMGTDRMTLMIGMNMAEYYKDLDHYRFAVLAIIPLSLVFLAAGGWIITNRALKPVSAITRTAEQITVQALHRRIPPMRTDSELGRLVEVINRMLDRLEKSFGQAARFSADAAHELQTPLTILMGELEDALQHAPMGSIEQERYTGLLEEVERLRSITRKLLILARADAGKLELHRELVDLSAMVQDAVEDVQVIAPHLRIEHDITPGIAVMADRALLEQAILNLTTNAVKYNSENGLVRFSLSVDGPRARIIISNTGDPIPDDEREKIFGRFYRIDPSRSRNISGSGLGLSLALEIARAHSGDLRLSPLSEDDMISFILLLPLKPAA